MGQISKSESFNAPVEKVWRIWADVEKTPDWVEGVHSSEITSVRREGRGLSWKEKCSIAGQLLDVENEVSEWETLKKVNVRSELPMGVQLMRNIEFCEKDSQTEVRIHLDYDLGMASLFISVERFHRLLEDNLVQTFANWKAKAETIL